MQGPSSNTSNTFVVPAFPTMVLVKDTGMPKEFNDRLFELGSADALKWREQQASGAYFKNRRHNLFADVKDPTLIALAEMIDAGCREFLGIFGNDYRGPLKIQSDVLWSRGDAGEREGMYCHTHMKADLVAIYYPRLDVDPSLPPLHKGALRIYDPSNKGKRSWRNHNQSFHIGGWLHIDIREGLLVVFEGHVPHDSSHFAGKDRLCVPCMINLADKSAYEQMTLDEIKEHQSNDAA